MNTTLEPVSHSSATQVAADPASVGAGGAVSGQELTPVVKKDESQDTIANGPEWIPQPAKDAWRWLGEKGLKARKASIEAVPAVIVNNSSNLLGMTHVATEVVMFKAGLKGANLVDRPEKAVNWVVEPFNKIKNDIVTNSKSRDYSFRDLFKGNVAKNFHKYITDTNGATIREAQRQLAANRTNSDGSTFGLSNVKLGNPWQTRSTFVGLLIWTISALIPEHKDSDEEVERMATMRTLHPIKYVGERLKQAVWVPDWTSHKRQMLGLGYMLIGVCSLLGSTRQRVKFKGDEISKIMVGTETGLKEQYTFNVGYLMTSLISFISSIPLLFALDENKGYSSFGSLMMLRIPFMFKSIGQKYKDAEPGRHSYTTGMVSFQAENAMQSLIGGATKLPDGTIVDHEDEKRHAIKEAKAIKRARRGGHNLHLDQSADTPHTLVSDVKSIERAIPQRVEAQKEAVAAV
ncbi:MAG: hypothetical protein ACOYNL_05725 [Rickettsiales bacterium]